MKYYLVYFPQDLQTPLLTDGKEAPSSRRATCCDPTTPQRPVPPGSLCIEPLPPGPRSPSAAPPPLGSTASQLTGYPRDKAQPLPTRLMQTATFVTKRRLWTPAWGVFFCPISLSLLPSLGIAPNNAGTRLSTNQNIHVALPSFIFSQTIIATTFSYQPARQ